VEIKRKFACGARTLPCARRSGLLVVVPDTDDAGHVLVVIVVGFQEGVVVIVTDIDVIAVAVDIRNVFRSA